VRGAWLGRAISSSAPGASFRLRYVGGSLAIIGQQTRAGGVAHITFDGRTRTIHMHAARRRTRRVIFRASVHRARVHHLVVRVVRGLVAIEGYAITARRG
jgi:hypothetical protein